MNLPEVLAGPVLRRAEPARVLLWLATSRPVTVHGEVVSLEPDGGDGPRRLGRGGARRVRLGPRLFVHLVSVVPDPAVGAFPGNHLLGYDLVLDDGAAGRPPRRLGDLGLLRGPRAITLGDLPLPSFFLPAGSAELNLLHGSCRLLHGHGEDALLAADELLTGSARDLGRRPSALVLTGDQIYGDEVGGPLIGHLTRLGAELLGPQDTTSVPGVPALDRIPPYGRQELCRELGFTSHKAANHLFSLGEFAAMYLVAWDEASWPERLPDGAEAFPSGGRGTPARQRHQYATELADLEEARRALPAVRRVLANLPTYMIFDDHDVSDDWNLTREWHDQVWRSPGGRRVVANALAAYWAFQGWGNAPEFFDEQFLAVVAAGPGDERFDRAMWSFDRWSYHAPTDPPMLVLDTRTQRTFDSDRGAARLLGDAELDRVRRLAHGAGVRAPGPAILVSATPVYGLELQERRQKFLVDKLGPYEIDFEAWHSNLQGLCDFMRLLVDELGLRSCVILSGDVHYGLNVQASFQDAGQVLSIAQLVSSGLKHSGTLARTALHLLGAAVRPHHARVGWETPPAVPTADRAGPLLDRLRRRPVNTDAWAEDAPVFLARTVAERIAAEQPPRFEEARSYVRPDGRRTGAVVGDNNVGLVTVRPRDGVVVQRLLARRAGRTTPHTATLSLRPERPPGAAGRAP